MTRPQAAGGGAVGQVTNIARGERRPRQLLFAGVSLFTIVLVAVTATLIVTAPDAPLTGTWGFRGFAAVLAAAFGGVGALILLRVPGNRVGALLVTIGLSAALVGFSVEYAAYGLVVRPGALPGALLVGWLVSWVWVVFAGLSTTFLLLLFPNGALLSPRWRWAAALSAVAIGLTAGTLAVLPGPIDNAPYLDNPLGVSSEWTPVVTAASAVGFVLLAAACVLSAASMVVRFRRSTGVHRQQMKWFAAAAVFAGLTLAGPGTLANFIVAGDPSRSTVKAFEILTILTFLTIPVATGIAVLRYHLYDIDRLLSRTVAWGGVTALLGILFVGVVLALQGVLATVTGGSTLAVAASTLLVAALAQPAARRVQALVDRRFFRARYDAGLTVDRFAARLRSEVDLAAIRDDVAGTVAGTVRPSHAGVWIRGDRS